MMLIILRASVFPEALCRARRTVPHAPAPSVSSRSSWSSVRDEKSPRRAGVAEMPLALILNPPFSNEPVSERLNVEVGSSVCVTRSVRPGGLRFFFVAEGTAMAGVAAGELPG
eukprot:scaffold82124_cov39-Tisochrysis_lutea.AAC.2